MLKYASRKAIARSGLFCNFLEESMCRPKPLAVFFSGVGRWVGGCKGFLCYSVPD